MIYRGTMPRLLGKLCPGPRLREAIARRGRVSRREAPVLLPRPLEDHDVVTGERNGALSPGGRASFSPPSIAQRRV
jgi:hypothetical protein